MNPFGCGDGNSMAGSGINGPTPEQAKVQRDERCLKMAKERLAAYGLKKTPYNLGRALGQIGESSPPNPYNGKHQRGHFTDGVTQGLRERNK